MKKSQIIKELQQLKRRIDNLEPIGNSEQLAVVSKMENPELEAGKWYIDANYLIYIKEIVIDCAVCYGFDREQYRYDMRIPALYIQEDCRLATPEEVEEALIKEAERGGLGYGATISFDKQKSAFLDEGQFVFIDGDLCWDNSGYAYPIIFQNGKWAEIISEEQTIDWSKPGQLVCNDSGVVVLTNGLNDNKYFAGFTLKGKWLGEEYKYNNDWIKEYWKPYNGTITLKND